MSANTMLIETVQEEEDGSPELFEKFDARFEDLYWKEDADGTLLVSDTDRRPETIVRVMLTAEGGISCELVEDTSSIRWSTPFISSPTSGVQDRQYD